jgi:hypothetical protein
VQEAPSRKMGAHDMAEQRPEKNNSDFELYVLGLESEDIGVALPLKRRRVVSKIHLSKKLTYSAIYCSGNSRFLLRSAPTSS